MTADHYINGQWRTGEGQPLTSINPADASIVWQTRSANAREAGEAVAAAHRALAGWSLQPVEERIQVLNRFAERVGEKKAELTQLISLEMGKPFWEAATEVSAVIGKIAISVKAMQERCAERQADTADAITHLRFKPHGVVAVLGAFNFPAHLSNGHIVPALLAGNTVVYKPSELTPGVAALIMQCWHDSGLPAGVLNCIQGDASTGRHLLESDIQGVYFTGSYQTGKRIHQHFSHRPDVILALEMGGNNPLIIDDDVDHDAAIYHGILSTLITSGQRCTCARRLFIRQGRQGDQLLSGLVDAVRAIEVADCRSTPEPFMGPVASHQQALNVLQAQQNLLDMGGKSLLSLRLLQNNTGLLSPGLVDMSEVSNPADEEIFGPLIQVWRYDHFEQALALANQTRYGLAAGLFSNNPQRYQQFYQGMRAGLINWNRPTTGAASNLPFGGVGQSGNHRPSAYFAADYCAYPVASLEKPALLTPETRLPGLK